jgi:hypothetical protein
MNKLSVIMLAGLMGVAAQAQVIDPLTGGLGGYTDTLILDNSGGASSLSFTDPSAGLQVNYVGTVAEAEQALFLAPANSFSTTFAVGDMLTVNTAVLTNGFPQEDFGLAISATATPPAAVGTVVGTGVSTRANFDWASISLRPSQTAIRANSSVSGLLTTSASALNIGNTANISELYIEWNSINVFTLGFVSNSIPYVDEMVTFSGTSTIGAAIGFYGDVRASGVSIGDFTDLSIQPIPEPATIALCGVGGFLGLAGWLRRKK